MDITTMQVSALSLRVIFAGSKIEAWCSANMRPEAAR